MTIKAILFDKDGTLLDFEGTYGPAAAGVIRHLASGDAALARLLAELVEFDLDREAFGESSTVIAGSAADLAELWCEHLAGKDVPDLALEIDALFTDYSRASIVPFQGLNEVLQSLANAGHLMGIATNDSEAGARSQLEIVGISSHFPFVAGYDSGFGAKPDCGMVKAFASHTGIPPSEIAMVGDSLHDMRCARGGGALAVAVASGMASADELAPFADHVIASVRDLPGLVSRLNAA
ncbi:MAG: HAD family hydrolase [Nitratireductor sp.]|nr:HAD family hydrolase [Nitratireductor sp.]MCC0019638.1 HAD family hydrolase [Nitratireductor sp.]